MAIKDWKYDESTVNDYGIIPEGDHRVRIESAKETVSKSSGNDMIEIEFAVSGYGSKLRYYIVFSPDNPAQTNTRLKQFWNCFGIEKNDYDCFSWIGKAGAAHIKHEEYNGKTRANVAWLIWRDKQDSLPAWVGEKMNFTETNATLPWENAPFSADELPL